MTNEAILSDKKIDLRRKGVFFILVASVFILQGIFFLNDTTTGILLVVIEFIYVFAFPDKKLKKDAQDSWTRKIARFLIKLLQPLIYVLIVVLVWVWLWKTTGMPVVFLAAITAALTGVVFVIWSFVPVYKD